MDKKIRNRPVGRKSASSIAIIIAISLYAFAQPHLNDRFGWNLPGLSKTQHGNREGTTGGFGRTQSDSSADSNPIPVDSAGSVASTDSRAKSSGAAAENQTFSPPPKNSGPLGGPVQSADRQNSAGSDRIADERMKASGSTPGKSGNKAPPTSNQGSADGDELLYGLLREIRTDRYISPEGLQYLPGSAEGHRLEHLRRHTEDQPTRPGKHGVFDGGMEGALATIDDAYQRAKKNQRTTKQIDRDRTIYTVDMGRRVGYVGGRDGNRQRKPMARRVKMVLEGTQVITAYPL